MQVKKFEAKSIKEALDLVKRELGPEAIILHVKDNKKKFGLAGSGSFEVTAAVSEKSLHKKKFTENRISPQKRDDLNEKSAKIQKSFIERTVAKYQMQVHADTDEAAATTAATIAASTPAIKKTPLTRKYVDIQEEDTNAQLFGQQVDEVLDRVAEKGQFVLEDSAQVAMKAVNSNREFDSLKSEMGRLRDQMDKSATNSSSYPGSEFGLSFDLSAIFEKLVSRGVDTRYAAEIMSAAGTALSPMERKRKSLVEAWVAKYLMAHMKTIGSWMRGQMFGAEITLFLGPSGHGKTSSLVKTAYHMAHVEKKKVVIFTCDTEKVGAIDQMKIYGQIMNIPVEVFQSSLEFEAALRRNVRADVILADYSGSHLRNQGEVDALNSLLPPAHIPKLIQLVMSCGMRDLDAYEIIRRYRAFGFHSIIGTKLDETSTPGSLYNFQKYAEKPLFLFGTGPSVPEDIELATPERVVDLLFKLCKATNTEHVRSGIGKGV